MTKKVTAFSLDADVIEKLTVMFPSEKRERSDYVNYLIKKKIL